MAAGVDPTTISRIERGQSVSADLARRVAEALHLSVADVALPDAVIKGVPLYDRTEEKASLDQVISSLRDDIAELRGVIESNVVSGRVVPATGVHAYLPVYQWGAAGDPAGDDAPEPVEYARPADEVGSLSPTAFGVRVKGDSMVGEGINDGDLVWIEPGPARPPCAVLARIVGLNDGDSGMVVKLYKRDRFLYAHSADGESPVACNEFTVIGPVVGVQPPARRMAWSR